MTIETLESHLGMRFSEPHRQAFLDLTDPIHEAVDFLVPSPAHPSLDILQVNGRLHAPPLAWPDFLVAFASNGCGDFFAYDCRVSSLPVIYVDPDLSVEENLTAGDKLRYESFAHWHASKLRQREETSPDSRAA